MPNKITPLETRPVSSFPAETKKISASGAPLPPAFREERAWKFPEDVDWDLAEGGWRFRMGVSLHEGMLRIRFPRREILIEQWPALEAWTRTPGKAGWRRYAPHLDLHRGLVLDRPLDDRRVTARPEPAPSEQAEFPFMRDCAAKPCPANACHSFVQRHFFNAIPERTRTVIGRYRRGQWHVLRLAVRHPETLDLVETNPALAFMLAIHAAKMGSLPPDHPWHEVHFPVKDLVKRKRREIAKELGFPGMEAAVRVLQKVPLEICRDKFLFELLRLAIEPTRMKWLSHFPVINRFVIEVGGRPFLCRAFHPDVLRELSLLRWTKEAGSIQQLEWMHEMASLFGVLGKLGRCRAWKQFWRFGARLFIQCHGFNPPAFSEKPLALIPVPGTPDIVPLNTPRLLWEEGRVQHNCAAMYAGQIAEGEVFMYRVLQPERATLEIILTSTNQGQRWEIGALLAACNQEVQEETETAVADWLRKTQE